MADEPPTHREGPTRKAVPADIRTMVTARSCNRFSYTVCWVWELANDDDGFEVLELHLPDSCPPDTDVF